MKFWEMAQVMPASIEAIKMHLLLLSDDSANLKLPFKCTISMAVLLKLPTLHLDDDCHSVLRQEESELNFFCHT